MSHPDAALRATGVRHIYLIIMGLRSNAIFAVRRRNGGGGVRKLFFEEVVLLFFNELYLELLELLGIMYKDMWRGH